MSFFISTIFGCAVCCSKLAAATDYFVSPSGSDSKAGTSQANAWKTIEKVNAVTLKAGDSVNFQGGQSFSGKLYLSPTDTGTTTNPITISSYGTGIATINAGSDTAIYIWNTAGIKITNVKLVGSGRSINTKSGISAYVDTGGGIKYDYLHIENVEVSGFGDSGISIGAHNGTSGFKNVTITRVSAHDNGRAGITTYGHYPQTIGYSHQNVTISHTKTYNNPGTGATDKNTGSGIVMGNVQTGRIEYSESYNNGSLNAHCGGPVGIWAWESDNIIIQHNESHHNSAGSSTGCDGGGFDFDGGVTNSILQYNYSHDNDGSGYLLAQFSGSRPIKNNTIRYNISQNDGKRNQMATGIHFWAADSNKSISDTRVYNNTFYSKLSTRAIVEFYDNKMYANSFYNNIFYADNTASLFDIKGTNNTFINNNYWSTNGTFKGMQNGTTYASLNSWTNATGQEKYHTKIVGTFTNPLLISPGTGQTLGFPIQFHKLTAYGLQPSSPLIDKGLHLSTLNINPGAHDFYSTLIPKGSLFDIGAHEYSSTPNPTPTPAPTTPPTIVPPTPTTPPSATPTPQPTQAPSPTPTQAPSLSPTTITWDLNNDGNIDIFDFSYVVKGFGGSFGVSDVVKFVGAFGK